MTEHIYKSGSVEELVELVFGGTCKEESSVQVEDTHTESIQDVFNFYITILHKGFKKIYGDATGRVHLSKLDSSDIAYIQRRFRALGWRFTLEPYLKDPKNTHMHYDADVSECYLVIWDREQACGYKIRIFRV